MTIEELEGVKKLSSRNLCHKTATLEFRQGNPEPRYQDVPLGSINSMGLPNNGLDYYFKVSIGITRKRTKPYLLFIISWNVSRGNSYHFEEGARK